MLLHPNQKLWQPVLLPNVLRLYGVADLRIWDTSINAVRTAGWNSVRVGQHFPCGCLVGGPGLGWRNSTVSSGQVTVGETGIANHLAKGYKGEVRDRAQCHLTMDKMRVVLLSLLVAVSTGAPSDPTSINPRENLSRSPSRFLEV